MKRLSPEQHLTSDDARRLEMPNLWRLVERLTIRVGCETELNREADLAQRELAALAVRLRAVQPELDNHHNALTCPYCNPKGFLLIEPNIWRDTCAKFEQQVGAVEAQQEGLRELIADFEEALTLPGAPKRGICPTCEVDHPNEARLNRAVIALTLRRLKALLPAAGGIPAPHSEVEEKKDEKNGLARVDLEGPADREDLPHSSTGVIPTTNKNARTVAQRVMAILEENLGVDTEEVTPQALLRDDLGCDSLDFIELVMAAEEDFHLEIHDADVEDFTTVQQCIDYITKRLSSASPAPQAPTP